MGGWVVFSVCVVCNLFLVGGMGVVLMERIREIEIAVEDFWAHRDTRFRKRIQIVKDVEYLLEKIKELEKKADDWKPVTVTFQESTGDG